MTDERRQQMADLFTEAVGRFPEGATVDQIVGALDALHAWDDAFVLVAVDKAKREAVRRIARERDDEGRPLAVSLPGADGPVYKQEVMFDADDYAQAAAYHERHRLHHETERDYYLGAGRARYGRAVRRRYTQLTLPVTA